jgi:hypothetical protein
MIPLLYSLLWALDLPLPERTLLVSSHLLVPGAGAVWGKAFQ